MKRIVSIVLALLVTGFLTACGSGQAGLQDGYYTAQAAEYSHGWREYITIMVKDGSIVSVEYNAENASGFIKSWDTAYMQSMLDVTGTYPNQYTRFYAGQLLEKQGEGEIDALTGATVTSKAVTRAVNSAAAFVTGADVSSGATEWEG